MATNIGFVDVGPPEMLSCKYCEYRDKDNAHKENADLFGVETKKMQTYLLEIRNMTCGYGIIMVKMCIKSTGEHVTADKRKNF